MLTFASQLSGETKREEDLFLSVEEIHVEPIPGSSKFGPIQNNCYIELICSIGEIEIGSEYTSAGVRYFWTWMDSNHVEKRGVPPDVYLDSPNHDFKKIKGHEGRMCCVPANNDSANNLICLLLQRNRINSVTSMCEYRRVGLTVIPSYKGTQDAVWKRTRPNQRIRVV